LIRIIEPTGSEPSPKRLTSGVFISQSDLDTLSRVAILGPTTAINLFGDGSDPVGSIIRINGQSFTVIGVTKSKGGTGFQNQDDIIWVPLTTAQKQLFGVNYVSSIAIEAKSAALMTQAQDQIGYLLLERHGKSDPTQADFSIFSQQDLLTTVTSTSATFTTLLSGVAAISLLVGGIGIMNIMLVTVTERTREIGLKKAIGAPRRLIVTQFLLESALLTFGGGIIGIILGITVSYIISKTSNAPFVISPSSVLLAFAVSVIIGIIFGAYPARKAASLEPIEALRYE
jgi:putative ABC transport system permease protein